MESQVREERTGWRDLRLNDRHRKWGWNCPALDIDLLFLEYDVGQPVAIVEYKHELADVQYASHPSYQALIALGDRANLPVFAVRYADDFSWWRVVPLNNVSKQWLSDRQEMTEQGWLELLYRIRGRQVPDNLFQDSEEEI